MLSSISLYGFYIMFIEVSSFKSIFQEGRMAQHVKVLAAKHDNLHSIPGTHIIEPMTSRYSLIFTHMFGMSVTHSYSQKNMQAYKQNKLILNTTCKIFLPDTKTFMLNSLLSLNVFPFFSLVQIALNVFCCLFVFICLPIFICLALLDTGLCYDIL